MPRMPNRTESAISMVEAPGGAGRRRPSTLPCRSGDPAQRLLEHLGRLAAGDQVRAVDHHRRHRVDAELLPEALALAHLGAELVGIEDGARRARRRGRPRRRARSSTSRAPGFSAAARGTRRAAHASAPAACRWPRARPSAAGGARRRCSRSAAARRTRSRPRRRARAGRRGVCASCSGGAPYLRDRYSVASSPSGGIAGLSSNGSKCSSTGISSPSRSSARVERVQADRAPRAGDVGDELDLASAQHGQSAAASSHASASEGLSRRADRARPLPRMFGSLLGTPPP